MRHQVMWPAGVHVLMSASVLLVAVTTGLQQQRQRTCTQIYTNVISMPLNHTQPCGSPPPADKEPVHIPVTLQDSKDCWQSMPRARTSLSYKCLQMLFPFSNTCMPPLVQKLIYSSVIGDS